jgi:hypothetical protein
MGQWLGQMITLDWDEHYSSYWFDLADLYSRKSWLPRRCIHTGESLWMKPCVKGVTEYYMRSGARRRDVRWISERFWFEQRLRYKGK